MCFWWILIFNSCSHRIAGLWCGLVAFVSVDCIQYLVFWVWDVYRSVCWFPFCCCCCCWCWLSGLFLFFLLFMWPSFLVSGMTSDLVVSLGPCWWHVFCQLSCPQWLRAYCFSSLVCSLLVWFFWLVSYAHEQWKYVWFVGEIIFDSCYFVIGGGVDSCGCFLSMWVYICIIGGFFFEFIYLR